MKSTLMVIAGFMLSLASSAWSPRIEAAGFNTGMLYRYPFEQGVTIATRWMML